MSWTTDRAKVAALTRSRKETDPELISARENLATSAPQRRFHQLTKSFGKALDALTPLSDAQILTLMTMVSRAGKNEASE
jgi:hypothetical protein